MQGFHCGIDIGDINLAITFLDRNSGKIVSYIGSVDEHDENSRNMLIQLWYVWNVPKLH